MQSESGRRRLLYIVPGTRTFAGIERVVDEIAAALAQTYDTEFEVDVLYTSRFENHEIGERPYHVIRTAPTSRRALFRTVRSVVRRKQYDLVVVPQIEATTMFWIACFGLQSKFVLHLHGNPRRERSHIKARILFRLMNTVVLPHLAGVFGTSPRQLASFKLMFPSYLPHFWVPNPVRRFEAAPSVTAQSDSGHVTFVSVGRFAYQKGQDLLLAAFAKFYEQRRDVKLRVVGYGSEEAGLRRQIDELGLNAAVSIEHYPENPEVPLANSDVFICTSRWEGWSLAICEALRFGLPVISTDCEFGPSDILTDKRLGRLVPDGEVSEVVDGLVQAMLYYYENLSSERELAEFRRSYIERFSVDQVVHVHAAALSQLARVA
jgi:glycosyltransferase involved in cell wall biosynthesis